VAQPGLRAKGMEKRNMYDDHDGGKVSVDFVLE